MSLPDLDWIDTEDENAPHPEKGRSRVEVKTGPLDGDKTMYRALTNEAAQAALEIASHSQQRLQSQQALISALAAVNLTICGAALSYFIDAFPKDSLPTFADKNISALLVGLGFLTVVDILISLQLAAAVKYHHASASSASLLARKHFRISPIHWHANSEYQNMYGLPKFLYNRHASFLLAFVACCMPLAVGCYIFLAI